MSARTESLIGKLSIQDSEWREGLARAATQFKTFSLKVGAALSSGISGGFGALKSMGGMLAGISGQVVGFLGALGGIGSLLSAAGITAGVKDITDLGGELSDMADRTGIAVGQLVQLREQFRQGGLDAGQVTDAVVKMNKALLDEDKSDLFSKLGLSQKNLLSKSPTDAIDAIIEKVRSLKSLASKQNILSSIFGKSIGPDMMTLVNSAGGALDAKKMVGGLPAVMEQFSAAFDYISDNLFGGIPVKLQQLSAGFTSALIDPLTKVTDLVVAMDFTSVGRKIGEQLEWSWKFFSQLWSNGDLFEYIRLGLSNALMGGFSFALQAVGIIFDELFTRETQRLWGIISAIGTYIKGIIQEVVTGLFSSKLDKMTPVGGGESQYEERLRYSKETQDDGMRAFANWTETYTSRIGDRIDSGEFGARLSAIQPSGGIADAMRANSDSISVITAHAKASAYINPNAPIQRLGDLNPLSRSNLLDPALAARDKPNSKNGEDTASGLDSSTLNSALDFLRKIEINTERTRLGLEIQ